MAVFYVDKKRIAAGVLCGILSLIMLLPLASMLYSACYMYMEANEAEELSEATAFYMSKIIPLVLVPIVLYIVEAIMYFGCNRHTSRKMNITFTLVFLARACYFGWLYMKADISGFDMTALIWHMVFLVAIYFAAMMTANHKVIFRDWYVVIVICAAIIVYGIINVFLKDVLPVFVQVFDISDGTFLEKVFEFGKNWKGLGELSYYVQVLIFMIYMIIAGNDYLNE
ncbi:MAG: hypothetical protein K6F92_09270 [Lachnospiraceae bacterium]|nr:hypothetical protein [Lachnospiraceae bacterium]